jgi:serine/threonine-protein kinase
VIVAGQSIGNYRILHKIGTGGMGAVFLAEHPLIGKRVALKVIHRELAGNRDVVSRFFQEARAVNKIGNEHIVEIHDFGVTPEGDHFFIMEYLEGKTLAAILASGSIEMMRSLHVGAQIAAALAAAHAAGIIHRDLKPDNIMLMARLGDQDFVKVLDFGLAKVFSAATAVKTAAGVLLGTPQYMSPEACESKGDVDHRTDIYALGVLLFQMMTGVLPFDGESMGEVLVKQVTALPPAPRALNPAIPPSVEQILLRCLAKPVDARFATMLDVREALLDPEAYLRGSPPIAPARQIHRGEGLGEAKTAMMTAVHAPYPGHAGPNPLPLPAPPLSIAGTAPTMIGGYGDYVPGRRVTTGMPALAPPQEPKMNTMRIATPMGYSSRPSRKVWPVVLVFALFVGIVGGAVAVAWSGDGGGGAVASFGQPGSSQAPARIGAGSVAVASAGSAAVASAGSAAVASAGSVAVGSAAVRDAGAAVRDAGVAEDARAADASVDASAGAASGSAAVAMAHLSIDSVPRGATVIGPDGENLGRTPLTLDWPKSPQPVTFELRLTGYRKKQNQTVVSGNTALRIELERASAVRRPAGGDRPTGAPANGSAGNGLMRPDE